MSHYCGNLFVLSLYIFSGYCINILFIVSPIVPMIRVKKGFSALLPKNQQKVNSTPVLCLSQTNLQKKSRSRQDKLLIQPTSKGLTFFLNCICVSHHDSTEQNSMLTVSFLHTGFSYSPFLKYTTWGRGGGLLSTMTL